MTDQVILNVGYDVENLADPDRSQHYDGPIHIDRYGRRVPKSVHGTANFPQHTSSTNTITNAVAGIFDSVVDRQLLIRRLNITTNHVVSEDNAHEVNQTVWPDLFADNQATTQHDNDQQKQQEKERRMQEAQLAIKQRFGKNAILRGVNFEEGATARERNAQIGGHKA